MPTPTAFTPTLPPQRLTALRRRLETVAWPDTIGADDWQYGVPSAWLHDMVDYWRDQWQWDHVQQAMEQWPHFRVDLDGVTVHYLHAQARNPDAPVLLLSHGWPWTFWDFKQVIGPLSRPEDYGGDPNRAFHVVVPSLPGFGFSTPLRQAGIDVAAIAALWVKLVTEVLGYAKFAAHGGDWGSLITAHLAHAHADVLYGAHMGLALIPGLNRNSLGADAFAADEQWMRERMTEAAPSITSHIAVHRLDPQTLAFALSDSPVGTAAWIWERRRNWSDCNGDIETAFDREHLCTTAALYWCTGAITSSLRLYFEHFNKAWPLVHNRQPVLQAPCAFAVFPKDVVHLPQAILAANCDLRRHTVMPFGGHFGAAEAPQPLVEDLRGFFFDDLHIG